MLEVTGTMLEVTGTFLLLFSAYGQSQLLRRYFGSLDELKILERGGVQKNVRRRSEYKSKFQSPAESRKSKYEPKSKLERIKIIVSIVLLGRS